MPRTVKDTNLSSREARRRLKPLPNAKPHWRLIEPGTHLGYRKPRGRAGRPSVAGQWLVRHYADAAYRERRLGVADDHADADGVSILNFAQAQAAARKHLSDRGHAAHAFTVAMALERYFDGLDGEGRSTYDARLRAKALILPVLGGVQCSSLTLDQLRRWRDDVAASAPRLRSSPGQQRYREVVDDEARRRRRSSTNRVLTILRAALNTAWRDGKVPSDKAWRTLKPFAGADVARVRYLLITEAQRLINACDHEFRLLVQGALQTGARYGSLAKLRVTDFNPDAGTVRLETRKGRGTLKVFHCTLTDEGRDFFREATAGKSSTALIFTHAGREWRPSEQTERMALACQNARIEPPISFHILRHTWASHAVMAAVPLMVVARNLGHSDTKMVEKYYGHLAPSFVTDAIRAGAPRFGFKPDRKIVPVR
ncbi:MAG TPA: site-specific integrase [Xanthobacteraceae bacterium]|jgi:integrase